jgi:hypothetical protein
LMADREGARGKGSIEGVVQSNDLSQRLNFELKEWNPSCIKYCKTDKSHDFSRILGSLPSFETFMFGSGGSVSFD